MNHQHTIKFFQGSYGCDLDLHWQYVQAYPRMFMRKCINIYVHPGALVPPQTRSSVTQAKHDFFLLSVLHLLQIVFISAATVQGPKMAAPRPARLLSTGHYAPRLAACSQRKPGPDATLSGLPRIILPKRRPSVLPRLATGVCHNYLTADLLHVARSNPPGSTE